MPFLLNKPPQHRAWLFIERLLFLAFTPFPELSSRNNFSWCLFCDVMMLRLGFICFHSQTSFRKCFVFKYPIIWSSDGWPRFAEVSTQHCQSRLIEWGPWSFKQDVPVTHNLRSDIFSPHLFFQRSEERWKHFLKSCWCSAWKLVAFLPNSISYQQVIHTFIHTPTPLLLLTYSEYFG